MIKVNPLRGRPSLRLNTNHVRWNHEPSPDFAQGVDSQGLRYHFVINRRTEVNCKKTLSIILEELTKYGGTLTRVRECSSRVGGWNMHYLFASYDSEMAPRIISWTNLDIGAERVKRDMSLLEGTEPTGHLEDYVAELYSASSS